jgi:signal transduction histidine kinase
LDNLIGNAWKYSAKNVEARIGVGQITYEGQPAFFVRDNGIGFSMDQANKLFQPFQRYTTEFTGTGLGLATCKRIIDRHGGRIWAESKVGEGATIYFVLVSSPGT